MRKNYIFTNKKFEEAFQGVLDEMTRTYGGFERTPPEILYHYTDLNGLIGIIDNGELWASHIEFLNDSSEYHYTRRLIAEAARHYRNQSASEQTKNFLDRIIKYYTMPHEINLNNVYAASFCKDGDSLGQWRGYAKGIGGYALGFDTQALTEISNATGTGNDHRTKPTNIVYTRDHHTGSIAKFIAELCKALDRLPLTKADSKQLFEDFIFLWAEYEYIFKNPAFISEDEWRIVTYTLLHQDLGRVNFRANQKDVLVPYIKLNLTPNGARFPLKEIVIGPNPRPHQAMKSLKMLLAKHNLLVGCKIEHSNVTLV